MTRVYSARDLTAVTGPHANNAHENQERMDDDAAASFVARLVAEIGRSSSFPPPSGHDHWSDDAVWELVATLYEKKGTAFVAEAHVAADDAAHLERRLKRTIWNYLKDEAKATPVGLMRSRLATMLRRDEGFVRIEDEGIALPGWARVDTPGAGGLMWQGDIGDLISAAWTVQVPHDLRFNSSGPAPKATRETLRKVVVVIFAAADDLYLPDQPLARVVTHRFDEFLNVNDRDATEFVTRSVDQPVPGGDAAAAAGAAAGADAGAADPTDDVDAADLADYIWTDLSVDERRAVGVLGHADNDEQRQAVQDATGCGPSEAAGIVAGIHHQIRRHCQDRDTALAVISHLYSLRRAQ